MTDISTNDKTKMAAARVLIEEKRYEAARELLKGIPNRQALDWLLKIDPLLPKRTRQFNWWSALVIILLLICLILLLVIAIRERDNQQRIWQAQKFEALISLSAYCEKADYTQAASCLEWAQNTINANLALTDTVVACEGDFFTLIGLDTDAQKQRQEQINTCLASKGIIPSTAFSSVEPSQLEATASEVVKMNLTFAALLNPSATPPALK